MIKQVDCGSNVTEYEREDGCTILKITDETGEGIMTIHNIMDGIILTENDMNLSKCVSEFRLHNGVDFLCIDHCREGRIETEQEGEFLSYMQEGDLRVDNRKHHSGNVNFPLNHFCGISVGFDLQIANTVLKKMYGGFSIDLYELHEKFCNNTKPYVLHAEKGIEHIFSELYHVPLKIREEYYKVKMLELLLYLDALQITDIKEEKPYFYKSQVEKVKAIHKLITENVQEHYTLELLSENFQISLTSMKKCFREIYGDSIYSYLVRYRMNYAASLLKQEKERTVAEIAGIVGYESPSKFSSAFHRIMGYTPLEYRKRIV